MLKVNGSHKLKMLCSDNRINLNEQVQWWSKYTKVLDIRYFNPTPPDSNGRSLYVAEIAYKSSNHDGIRYYV